MKPLLSVLFILGVLLPCLPLLAQDWPKLARYAKADSALPVPAKNRPRVVLMGNSITEAWVTADSAFFKMEMYDLVGRGIAGQASGQMLLRFRQDVIDLHPQVAVILAGTNDIAGNAGPYSEQATLNNIISMADLAKANGIKVVLCSVLPVFSYPWKPGLEPAGKILSLNNRIKAYAAAAKLSYVDYHTAMADERQGLPAALAPDGVHPNLAGYKRMEPLLLKGIEQALRR